MAKTLLFLILGVSAGLVVAAWLGGARTQGTDRAADSAGVVHETRSGSGGSSVEERLAVLETALQQEIDARLALEQEIVALNEELRALRETDGPRAARARDDEATAEPERNDPQARRAGIAEGFAARGGRDSPERRMARLVEAGFSADEAQRIAQRESELRMEALYAQYEATRAGESFNPLAGMFGGQDQLRRELGDADYERYLEATGQPTRVGVRQVLASSPAQAAGLQGGDEVIAYAGERVFNMADLNRLTLQGDPGEPVAVDVLRDGQQIQLYVPRGPIGITAGRGFPGGRGGVR